MAFLILNFIYGNVGSAVRIEIAIRYQCTQSFPGPIIPVKLAESPMGINHGNR